MQQGGEKDIFSSETDFSWLRAVHCSFDDKVLEMKFAFVLHFIFDFYVRLKAVFDLDVRHVVNAVRLNKCILLLPFHFISDRMKKLIALSNLNVFSVR